MAGGIKRKRAEEIASESDTEEEYQNDVDNEDEYETAHQAQVRMKKNMIKKLKEDLKNKRVENVDDVVRKTLEEEALDKQGKVMKDIAYLCSLPTQYKVKLYKNKNFITCLTYSEDGTCIFTGNSAGDIIKWDLSAGKSLAIVKGGRRHSDHKYHKSRVSAIATSGEYVATGDLEKKIFIWNMNLEFQKILLKHRHEITSLVFRRHTTQLFSGDRKGIIFVWDMILMNTIEELLGHTSAITDLDSDLANHCLSCSGIGEPCVKLWKLENDSMLCYNLPKNSNDLSIDCISLLNEKFFVAGTTNNKIYLWDGVAKKSPIDVVQKAHDLPEEEELRVTDEINVVSICALKHTCVFASGSNMSQVKIWSLVHGKSDNFVIQLLFVLPNIRGCVNGLKFSPNGKDLAVAVSNQHKRHRIHSRCPHTNSMVTVHSLFQ